MSVKLDRRKKYTRMLLKESLMKLMQEKPLSNITIKEICDLADINRSTFYSHYTDLYDLLYQIEDEIIKDLSEALSSYNYTKDEEALQMTENLLVYIANNRESCQTLFSEYGDPSFQKKVMMLAHDHVIKTPLVGKHTKPDISEYVSLYIVNGSIHIVQSWLKNGLKQSPKEMAELIIKLGNRGLSSFQ
ncbi:TetR-like C-terminal domain-containing protein [Halalkalibacterium halodurans]|uniref:Transcriptional regulator (TetR/AcrR family) n=1 Tax=Halalkalibacterium halodurans (strain ATCC BAA-125 / DSM 18197 / FERM 7344 / JCM 9153 / C-125) TaxID=272558 RepID=Q9KEY0_HALH5|nr:TetR-like C-terminal domain-containing protein [Halalkalibacterium halodurans]MED4172158.1 TetR-like C-terminal domain-containing protein [Halalkalibacterium halodurans]BAB04438.1 transcriptional regulator (TetR/AcrR family) [Halalkalibacterium halodurans C-125]